MNIARVFGLAAAVASAAVSAADGSFMASRRVEAKPTIPYQRAFISWRAGKETMIVESVLNASKGDYAWVVPLPAVPSKVAACAPGTLESVAQLARPTTVPVDDGLVQGSLSILALFAFAGIWTAVRRTTAGKSQTTRFLKAVLVMMLLAVIPAAVMFPVYAGPSPQNGVADGVVVRAKGNAGVYSYEVVSSESGHSLEAWLAQNGYGLPAEAKSVVDDYVKKEWCFAAMKLRHDGSASTAPHPVKFVFDAKSPVYPMALTGSANDKMRLDLFVLATGEARVDGLEIWRTQTVDRTAPSGSTTSKAGRPGTTPAAWKPVGHPEIAGLLWKGATLTYLRGDLRARDMKRDFEIVIGRKPAGPFAKSVYSVGSAAGLAGGYGALAASALLVILTFWATRKPFGFEEFARVFALSVGIAATGGLAWFISVQKIPVTSLEHPIQQRAHIRTLEDALLNGRQAGESVPFPDWWIAEVEIRERRKPAVGDVPGGYTLKPMSDGWILTVYDPWANPIEFRVDKRGNPVVERWQPQAIGWTP